MITDTYNSCVAGLSPFRALRPVPAAAAAVAAVPYDVVSVEEARILAHGNPLSFLHVSRAEIDLPSGTDPYADAVYAKAVSNFGRLRDLAPLVMEAEPSFYVYRLRMGTHQQTGIAAGFSLDEYATDAIKKHERTRHDKEDDRTRHMLAIGAQTGPVFLVFRAAADIAAVVERTAAREPLFDFEASDGIRHVVWKVDSADQPGLQSAFGRVASLYIADGHHRAASAARARGQLRARAGAGEWDRFLGVAFPHNEAQILAYNRLIKDLGDASPESFLARLRRDFAVEAGPPSPVRRGDVSMFLAGQWYTIKLGEASPPRPAADRLDVNRLQEMLLTPILGIGDVRTDKRIDFVGGARGVAVLERAVTAGRAAVAFSLHPVSLDDLMAIADEGGIMPPKSTWFEPKLRDGLLSHVF